MLNMLRNMKNYIVTNKTHINRDVMQLAQRKKFNIVFTKIVHKTSRLNERIFTKCYDFIV